MGLRSSLKSHFVFDRRSETNTWVLVLPTMDFYWTAVGMLLGQYSVLNDDLSADLGIFSVE